MATLEERKEEALKRLNILKTNGMAFAQPIEAFKKGSVGIFENQGRIARAVYYDLYLNKGDNDKYDRIIKYKEELEQKWDYTVYLILISHYDFGDIATMFYVSECKEDWEYDRQDLKEGYTYADCFNMTEEDFSEGGTIGFSYDAMYGGLYRTA